MIFTYEDTIQMVDCKISNLKDMEENVENFTTVVIPLHECWQFLDGCCDLLDSEWPAKSNNYRMNKLKQSQYTLPTSLVLVLKSGQFGDCLVGYCRIVSVKGMPEACYIESVVIKKQFRGKGLGRFLMNEIEKYAIRRGITVGYLETATNNELFYSKLGYRRCDRLTIHKTLSKSGESFTTDCSNVATATTTINTTTATAAARTSDGISSNLETSFSNSDSNSFTNIPVPPPLPAFHSDRNADHSSSDFTCAARPKITMKKLFHRSVNECSDLPRLNENSEKKIYANYI